MILKLDMNSSTPIYAQLRNQIVLGIGRGEFKIGENLPTVRQLAEDIGVNTMTVNKAYSILKAEGYIEIHRRYGAKIAPIKDHNSGFNDKIENDLNLILTEASLKGYNRKEILNLCQSIIDNVSLHLKGVDFS